MYTSRTQVSREEAADILLCDIENERALQPCRNPLCLGWHLPDTFGCCYNCQDGLCEDCVGVPCDCRCPGKSRVEVRRDRIARLRSELLTLEAEETEEAGCGGSHEAA